MSGVHRFLSKREKHHLGRHHGHDKEKDKSSPVVPARPIDPNSPAEFYGLFDGKGRIADSHEEQKVKALRKRVMDHKAVMMKDAQILYALHSNFAHGDVDKAFDLLLAISNASEGLVMDYDPSVKLLGAENRQGVTCYLDSILFGMFSKLDSFEAMLYNTFDDVPRSKLGLLLRLWVNLLRSGKLITVDITKLIQEALAECGWVEAAKLCQQDASEAFTFLTGKLELPLLTLKMDIYHTGKEDEADDHKFINERLLEVAIPHDPSAERQIITLEDCLEEYFNNRIEVRRYLERRSTINSVRSIDPANKASGAIHIETVELDSSNPTTPLSSSPSHTSASRPSNRHRAPSIIQERYFPENNESGYNTLTTTDSKGPLGRLRTGSIRKEVMMPAWQFFSLIPWYTDHAPSNDAQVAAHFSTKRPVLGMCLKRYSMTARGRATRLDTQIDIPIEIGLPHFIQDDHMVDSGPLYGNFKLLLQSVVCHRGNSVDSGHYISLTRATTSSSASSDPHHWLRFDDLATRRITLVEIEKALKEEAPYLLFYQIVPIEGDPGHIIDGEQAPSHTPPEAHDSGVGSISTTSLTLHPSKESQPASDRPSVEIMMPDDQRGRSPVLEARRPSIAFSEPAQNAGLTTESVASRTSSRGGSPSGKKSRSLSRTPSRRAGETLTKAFSRLSGTRSKEVLVGVPVERVGDAEIHTREVSNSVSTLDGPRPVFAPATARVTHPAQHPHPPQNSHQKPHKREKSRNRLSRGGKMKDDKPDRECVVM